MLSMLLCVCCSPSTLLKFFWFDLIQSVILCIDGIRWIWQTIHHYECILVHFLVKNELIILHTRWLDDTNSLCHSHTVMKQTYTCMHAHWKQTEYQYLYISIRTQVVILIWNSVLAHSGSDALYVKAACRHVAHGFLDYCILFFINYAILWLNVLNAHDNGSEACKTNVIE